MTYDFLQKKLLERTEAQSFRRLKTANGLIDFCSNDYLGVVTNGLLESKANGHYRHGSTGSRLLSGNYPLIEETEKFIADFHEAETALIFNSGYDANVGLLSCVPQRGDVVLYDHLCHASIRDGIRLSFAQAYSFRHNDVEDLSVKIRTHQPLRQGSGPHLRQDSGHVFIVTESVFSMDGDIAPVQDIIHLCKEFNCHLIIDEAHATGIIGTKGEGLMQHLQLHHHCFARVHTFGKAMGAHGAAVLGSNELRDYLINFSRAFIYTTALPEASVAAIKNAYTIVPHLSKEREQLKELVKVFQNECGEFQGRYTVLASGTPIQGIVVPGNEAVKHTASLLQNTGFDVRPILYPTVPKGAERLRIVLHSFNTPQQLQHLINQLIS